MKINSGGVPLSTNETTAMKMNIDDKAFSLLIDGLYSRKNEAVLRELVSNAYDSHVMANNTHLSIDITLPTKEDNKLTIRDYGIGLSKNDTERLLGTIFESDSSNSNSTIGGFGLGAKSPFAITDTYHVTSYHNNKKHKFMFVREGGGIPSFIHISTSDTSEHNGIEFTVPTKKENSQLSYWVELSSKTLQFMQLSINFTNACVEFNDIIEISDKLLIMNDNRYNRYTSYYILMGGVRYTFDEFDNKKLIDVITNSKLDLNRISNIIFKFDIGDIDVSPNRESVSFTQKTISAINEMIKVLPSQINNFICKQKKLFVKYINDGNGVDKIGKQFPFLEMNEYYKFTQLNGLINEFNLSKKDKDKIEINPTIRTLRNVLVGNRKKHKNQIFDIDGFIDYDYNKVIIKDKRVSNANIRYGVSNANIVIIKPHDKSNIDLCIKMIECYISYSHGKDAINSISLLSDIELIKPPKKETNKTKCVKNVRCVKHNNKGIVIDTVSQETLDNHKNIIYYDNGNSNAFSNIKNDSIFKDTSLRCFMSHMHDIYDDSILIVCKDTYIDAIKSNKKYTNIKDAIKKLRVSDDYIQMLGVSVISSIFNIPSTKIKKQLKCTNKRIDYTYTMMELHDSCYDKCIDFIKNYINNHMFVNVTTMKDVLSNYSSVYSYYENRIDMLTILCKNTDISKVDISKDLKNTFNTLDVEKYKKMIDTAR